MRSHAGLETDGANLKDMSDKITKLALVLVLGVIVGISFSAMLVALFIATGWRALSLSGLI
ncbi:hypothetical protein NT945_003982 [Salmonella enterica]|nr:hypothetical protein [Salmonella enterica]